MILDGLRVDDRSESLAGAYCAKLLTDLGATVAYRRHARPGGELWAYLRTSQCEVAPDWETGVADIVLQDGPGTPLATGNPVTVGISSFGGGGPDSDNTVPEALLQARCGALSLHGHPGQTPLTIGGEIGEYVTGAFAALGALTAWRRAQRSGQPELVDVSMLEAMQLTMTTVPTLMARFPGGRLASFRFVMMPGNEPCADGNFAGVTALTRAQWRALLRVVGREDLLDDRQLETMVGRFMRAGEVQAILLAFTMQHPAADVVDACARERIPAAVVANGELLTRNVHLEARRVFVTQPGEDWVRPRAPFHFSAVADRTLEPPRSLRGEWPEPARARLAGGIGERPLEGIRVLDFTAFWSGPFATAWLAAMGADVIKVESIQRPDGIRFTAPLFCAANLNKRGITLDLTNPSGIRVAEQLIATSDIVAENFTPRVLEQFGLGYERIRELSADAIMLRIPAFGLDGPWRDRPGFAQTMEQVSGMAWVTGYEGGPPIIPGGVVDPLVGVHAALAVMAALEYRDHTGEGQLVEVPMIEVALATTAAQVIEWSARHRIAVRRGEGGVYRCMGDDEWVAVDRVADPMNSTDRASWCASRTPAAAVAQLEAAGIAAAAVAPAHEALDDPQLVARGFFEPVADEVVGEQRYPRFPVRMSGGPARCWVGPAPRLGEHTEAILRAELGVGEAELEQLRKDQVIGTEPGPR